MKTEINVQILDLFVFLAIFQAVFISYFILKNGRKHSKANLYQGLFLLSFAFLAVEEFLNNTGYITKFLLLTGISQPLNYVLGPLFYLYVLFSLYPDKRITVWYHFIIPLFWACYIWFYLLQPDEVKYNSFIKLKHPNWAFTSVTPTFSEDPLSIRKYANELTILSLLVYDFAALLVILNKIKSLRQSFFNLTSPNIVVIRNSFLHCFIVAVAFSVLKFTWGMTSDVGMIVICYFCIYIFILSYRIADLSTHFNQPFSVLDFPVSKYKKSSLTELQKDEILQKIKYEMEVNLYFTDNLSSLSGLAMRTKQSSHHISQVINERLGKTYFELLSFYRVDYAKKLMAESSLSRLTIEEIADKVGYNSKSSFNTAFKKFSSLTPSEYRKGLNKV